LLDIKNQLYIESLKYLNPNSCFSYIKELFQLLKSRNIKIAIASASKNAKFILEKLNLLDQIDFISDPNLSPSKPDPGIFLQAFNNFNFKKDEVICVEDSQAGIDAINSISIKSIGVNNNNLKNCSLYFNTIQDFYNYLVKE
jgi:beta-phosphoglucomutase